MSPKPSRMVALVAALALAACSKSGDSSARCPYATSGRGKLKKHGAGELDNREKARRRQNIIALALLTITAFLIIPPDQSFAAPRGASLSDLESGADAPSCASSRS